MRPAESVRDRDLPARVCLALGASAVRPAVPARLGAVDAARDLALGRAAWWCKTTLVSDLVDESNAQSKPHRGASSDPGAWRGLCNPRSDTACRPGYQRFRPCRIHRERQCETSGFIETYPLVSHAPRGARRVPGPRRTARSRRTCRCGSVDDAPCASVRPACRGAHSVLSSSVRRDLLQRRRLDALHEHRRARSSSLLARSLTCVRGRYLHAVDSGTRMDTAKKIRGGMKSDLGSRVLLERTQAPRDARVCAHCIRTGDHGGRRRAR